MKTILGPYRSLPLAAFFLVARSAIADDKARSPAGQDAARAWGKPVEGQAISISTERSAYAPGDRVVVKIRFKNLGTKDVRAGTSGNLE